jgi:hypothetical protein
MIFSIIFIVLLTLPTTALAYVDPGLVPALSQLIYVFFSVILLGWILRPFRFLRGLFSRKSKGGTDSSNIDSGAR